jgi:hypothetical protein
MPKSRLQHAGLILGILAAPVSLAAQQNAAGFTRFDLALGFTIGAPADVNQPPLCTELDYPCLTPRTMPDFGFVATAVLRANRFIGIAGEASAYGNAWDTTGVNHSIVNHVSAFLAGPRLELDIAPFGHGSSASHYTASAQLLFGNESSNSVPTRFAVQPGVGIQGAIAPERLWLRAAFDYRKTNGPGRNLSSGRFSLALVLGFLGDRY